MAKILKTWGWTGQREVAVCGSNPDGFTREIVCADSRDDAIALASPGFGAPVPDDLYVSRLAGEKRAAAAVPGVILWKPQHLPGLPFQATLSPAEALARVSHPERDHRPGDWGARVWSQMRPEWRESAISEAEKTLASLAAVGYILVPGPPHV
jgi:hypothetical protein